MPQTKRKNKVDTAFDCYRLMRRSTIKQVRKILLCDCRTAIEFVRDLDLLDGGYLFAPKSEVDNYDYETQFLHI